MKNKYTVRQIKKEGQAAKRIVYQKKIKRITGAYGYWIPRIISPYITWVFLKFFPSINPDTVSIMMILTCMVAQIFIFKGLYLIGGLLLYFSIILDNVDGEVARLRNISSGGQGILLDLQYHFICWLFFLFLGLNLYLTTDNIQPLILGALTTFLGTYLRYTKVSYEKIIFQLNLNTNDENVKKVKNYIISNKLLDRIFAVIKVFRRQNSAIIVFTLCACLEFFFKEKIMLNFLRFYFLILLSTGAIVFIKNMRGNINVIMNNKSNE
ncbi:CDP-alcohol phosphatidyltransferase family protein [Elusimicrobiota bacterium]